MIDSEEKASPEQVIGTYAGRDRTLPFDIWAYRNDETEYWELPDGFKEHIKNIFCVEMFDRNTHVNACEITPSYEMMEVYYDVEFLPDTPENIVDEIQGWVLRNADYSEPFHYNHVSSIDKLIESKPELFNHYGNPAEVNSACEGEDFDYQWERTREDISANYPF